MATANVFDVAKYILREIGGEISTMKLQKLCYYAFVQRLKDSGEKLFDQPFEAWANGPVCRELFNVHKGNFFVSAGMIPNDKLTNKLTQEEMTSINIVVEAYSQMTGAEISEKTHAEEPWKLARRGIPLSQPCRNRITLQSIRDYYGCPTV